MSIHAQHHATRTFLDTHRLRHTWCRSNRDELLQRFNDYIVQAVSREESGLVLPSLLLSPLGDLRRCKAPVGPLQGMLSKDGGRERVPCALHALRSNPTHLLVRLLASALARKPSQHRKLGELTADQVR